MRKFLPLALIWALLPFFVFSQTTPLTPNPIPFLSMPQGYIAALPLPNQPVTLLQSLTIFPNPVISSATIRMTCKELGNSAINIFDNSGRLVRRIAFVKTQATYQQLINLSTLVRGIYTVEAVTGTTIRLRVRIIKQ